MSDPRDLARASRKPPPPILPPVGRDPIPAIPDQGQAAHDPIVAAVRRVDRASGGYNLVSLTALRAELALAGITSRQEQDAAINAARRAGFLSASAVEGRHGITPEEQTAAIDEGGTMLGYVSLRLPGERQPSSPRSAGPSLPHPDEARDARAAAATPAPRGPLAAPSVPPSLSPSRPAFTYDMARAAVARRQERFQDAATSQRSSWSATALLGKLFGFSRARLHAPGEDEQAPQPGLLGRLLGSVTRMGQGLHAGMVGRYGEGWVNAMHGVGGMDRSGMIPDAVQMALMPGMLLAAEAHRGFKKLTGRLSSPEVPYAPEEGVGDHKQTMAEKLQAMMVRRYGAKTAAGSMMFGQIATWLGSIGTVATTGMPLPPGSGVATAVLVGELVRKLRGKKKQGPTSPLMEQMIVSSPDSLQREHDIRAHEEAHASKLGRWAVGSGRSHVDVDLSPEATVGATIEKMRQIREGALAPLALGGRAGRLSRDDVAVAEEAGRRESAARQAMRLSSPLVGSAFSAPHTQMQPTAPRTTLAPGSGPDPAKALEGLAQAAMRAAAKLSEIARAQVAGAGAAAPGGVGLAPGQKEQVKHSLFDRLRSGFQGKVMGVLGAGYAVSHVADSAARSIGAANDPTMSESRRAETIREGLPLIGGLFRSFRGLKEAVNGTTAAIAKMREQFGAQMERIQAAGQMRLGIQSTEARREDLEARQYAFSGYKGIRSITPALIDSDRTTVAGEREYESAQRQLPLQRQQRTAELARIQAGIQSQDSGRDLRFREEQVRQAEQKARAAQDATQAALQRSRGATKGKGKEAAKVQEERALRSETLALAELDTRRNELAQALARHEQNAVGLAQANSAARKALVELDKERLYVLKEQEQKIKGAAQSFGHLSEAEKVGAVQAAAMAKMRGVGGLTDEQRQLLGRAGGQDFVNKGVENIALADPRFKQMRELIGERADLKQVQKEIVKVTNEIEVQITADEKQLADELKKEVGPMIKRVTDKLREEFDTRLRDIEVKIFLGRVTR